MSSLTVIICERVACPFLTNSWALLSQTFVPCESPDILTSSANVVGLMSISICLTKPVPNSQVFHKFPISVPISSGVTPKDSVDENILKYPYQQVGYPLLPY